MCVGAVGGVWGRAKGRVRGQQRFSTTNLPQLRVGEMREERNVEEKVRDFVEMLVREKRGRGCRSVTHPSKSRAHNSKILGFVVVVQVARF